MMSWDENRTIPFTEVILAIKKMSYGTTHRVMFTMQFLTGCRGSELNNMEKSKLRGNTLYWKKGKNQKGYRKEELPPTFVEELDFYWKHNRTTMDAFFSINAETFRTQFDKHIRKMLGGKWEEKKQIFDNSICSVSFIYQLNYLRKDFWTLDYANNLKTFKSAEIALYMTQRRAGHKSPYMTCVHYIRNFAGLNIERYQGRTIQDIYNKEIIAQMPLLQWCEQ